MKLAIKWSEAEKAVKGRLCKGDPGAVISGITTDSRRSAQGLVFIALKGLNHDGHAFLGETMVRGISGWIIEKNRKDMPARAPGWVLETPDTLKALQNIAVLH